uniref:Uncharacterized protein n=1 Tax=Arundo donax TaxID=35708 RepID=A0A0A9AJR8_ARUDO
MPSSTARCSRLGSDAALLSMPCTCEAPATTYCSSASTLTTSSWLGQTRRRLIDSRRRWPDSSA